MNVSGAAVTVATSALLLLAACGGGGGGEGPATIAAPPTASQIRVIDADTVDVDGERYRLFGIDAPEARQTCRAWGRAWNCGTAATEALMSRAEGMSCSGSGTDRYGRTIGVCSSGGEDLNAWLVANGWALAYRQYAEDYVGDEELARTNKRGMHRGEFVDPWDWRRGERIEGEDTFAAITSGELNVDALVDRMLRGDLAGVYGQWLEDSVFAIVDDAVAISFGDWPATTPLPAGGAAWKGALVGMDTQAGKPLEGDALIEISDFARLSVDIALTSIEDAQGRARADLHWAGIPVVEGAFRSRETTGSIEGRFYGSDHSEVGGIFESGQLIGAFGASR